MNQYKSYLKSHANNILTKLKIGNSFLFLGIFLLLISFFSQLIIGQFTSDNIPQLNLISIKIGLITLIFGGIFSLLNVLTNPYQNLILSKERIEKNIDPFNKEALKPSNYKLFLDLLNRYEKNILYINKTNYTEIEGNNWNNLFIYSLWTFFLIIYVLWINIVIQIIPTDIDFFFGKINSFYIVILVLIILIIIIILSFRNSKHHINPIKAK